MKCSVMSGLVYLISSLVMAKDRIRGTRVTNLNFLQNLIVREARMRNIGNTNRVEHWRQTMGILGNLGLIDWYWVDTKNKELQDSYFLSVHKLLIYAAVHSLSLVEALVCKILNTQLCIICWTKHYLLLLFAFCFIVLFMPF